MELPPELQQSLRASQEQSRFSLVFEGINRRHVSSCVLIDNSYVIASIPGKFARHQYLGESMHEIQDARVKMICFCVNKSFWRLLGVETE